MSETVKFLSPEGTASQEEIRKYEEAAERFCEPQNRTGFLIGCGFTHKHAKEMIKLNDEANAVRNLDIRNQLDAFIKLFQSPDSVLKELQAQLSSKEQECEELKKQASEMADLSKDDAGKIDMLNIDLFVAHTESDNIRAENERLKTELSEKGRECEALRLVMKDDKRVTENEVNDLQAEIDRVCKLHAQERKRCEDLEAACRKVIDPNDDFDSGIDEIKKLLSQ